MAIDNAKLGEFMAKTMDDLTEEYGENAELGEVLIITEVNIPYDESDEEDVEVDEDDRVTHILYHCTHDRRWAQLGLLKAATLAAETP